MNDVLTYWCIGEIISASCRRREEMRLVAEMKEDKN